MDFNEIKSSILKDKYGSVIESSMSDIQEKMIIESLEYKLNEEFTEDEFKMIAEFADKTKQSLIDGGMPEENITEGFLGSLIGGAAGFFIGPSIGKVIARALGIEKGVLYDLFSSKLVGIALGTAISKSIGRKK